MVSILFMFLFLNIEILFSIMNNVILNVKFFKKKFLKNGDIIKNYCLLIFLSFDRII